jgi:putative DNA primase/helicase
VADPKPPDANDRLRAGTLPDDPFAEAKVFLLPAPEGSSPPAPGLPVGLPCTDVGNGARFVAMFGEDVRFCQAFEYGGWLLWRDGRWAVDDCRRVVEMAKAVARSILDEAAAAQSEADDEADADQKAMLQKRADALYKHARSSESMARLKAMLEAASSVPGIPVRMSDLDADPWLLNAKNGVIDLRTGQLLPHDRRFLQTQQIAVEYNPHATCPTWLKFLSTIMGANAPTMAPYLRRAAGYSMIGANPEQCLFMLYGGGRNGKSTFINATREVMGTYAKATPVDTLLAKKAGGEIRNDLAALAGVRLVTTAEPAEGRPIDESMVKQITGGDPIVARFLNKEFFEYVPRFVAWLSMNHLPPIRGTDLGIWRRVRLLPFEVTIADTDVDAELPEKLRAEYPGILAWMVHGLLEWLRDGMGVPKAVSDATLLYRQSMDFVEQFLADCCERGPHLSTENGDLYLAYQAWCRRQGEPALGQGKFTKRLLGKGYVQKRAATRYWEGIKLLEEAKPRPQTSWPEGRPWN